MSHQTFTIFSIRRLNPFKGVLQVVLGDKARALSANGKVWEIQVLSDKLRGLRTNPPWSPTTFAGEHPNCCCYPGCGILPAIAWCNWR